MKIKTEEENYFFWKINICQTAPTTSELTVASSSCVTNQLMEKQGRLQILHNSLRKPVRLCLVLKRRRHHSKVDFAAYIAAVFPTAVIPSKEDRNSLITGSVYPCCKKIRPGMTPR